MDQEAYGKDRRINSMQEKGFHAIAGRGKKRFFKKDPIMVHWEKKYRKKKIIFKFIIVYLISIMVFSTGCIDSSNDKPDIATRTDIELIVEPTKVEFSISDENITINITIRNIADKDIRILTDFLTETRIVFWDAFNNEYHNILLNITSFYKYQTIKKGGEIRYSLDLQNQSYSPSTTFNRINKECYYYNVHPEYKLQCEYFGVRSENITFEIEGFLPYTVRVDGNSDYIVFSSLHSVWLKDLSSNATEIIFSNGTMINGLSLYKERIFWADDWDITDYHMNTTFYIFDINTRQLLSILYDDFFTIAYFFDTYVILTREGYKGNLRRFDLINKTESIILDDFKHICSINENSILYLNKSSAFFLYYLNNQTKRALGVYGDFEEYSYSWGSHNNKFAIIPINEICQKLLEINKKYEEDWYNSNDSFHHHNDCILCIYRLEDNNITGIDGGRDLYSKIIGPYFYYTIWDSGYYKVVNQYGERITRINQTGMLMDLGDRIGWWESDEKELKIWISDYYGNDMELLLSMSVY